MSQLNPDDFVITRRRKKYKFAKFANAENCFEFDEWTPRVVDVVELGAGTALFSVELATMYPDKTFAAIDVKADRLQKGAYEALDRGLKNIVFIRARADQINDLLPEHSVSQLYLTFPDPFPGKSSGGRRMTHPNFLRLYRQVLKKEGSFVLKHDDLDFFLWSLEQIVNEGWILKELSFDLHESTVSQDNKILTSYEGRWLADGRKIYFIRSTAAHRK